MNTESYPDHINLNKANENRIDVTFWEKDDWVEMHFDPKLLEKLIGGIKKVLESDVNSCNVSVKVKK